MEQEARDDEREFRKTIDLPVHSLEGCARDYLLDSVDKRSRSRYDGIRFNLVRWILPFFGGTVHVNTITGARIEEFIKLHRKRGVKNITVWHYVKDLRALFNWAIRKGRMIENPVLKADLEPIRKRKAVKPPLNMQAINKGIETISGRDRLYVDVLRYMGLRKDEGNRIQVRDVLDYETEMWLMVRGTKTEDSNRVLPIPPILHAGFREAIDKLKPENYPLCNDPTHKLYHRRRLFDRISKAAGVKVKPKDMRDYFVSICDDPVVASQMAGHTGLDTTAIYTRQVRERMQKGVEKIGTFGGKFDA